MRMLLVEDMAGFGLPIKKELEARGHTVTWIIGAQQLQTEKLIGILADKNASPMEDSWSGDLTRLVEVDLSGFKLAFVDGGLIGPVHDGAAIIPTLVANRIVCVAISGGGAGNQSLLNAGARFGIPKELVLLALRTGGFSPSAALFRRKHCNEQLERWLARVRRERETAIREERFFETGFTCLHEDRKDR